MIFNFIMVCPISFVARQIDEDSETVTEQAQTDYLENLCKKRLFQQKIRCCIKVLIYTITLFSFRISHNLSFYDVIKKSIFHLQKVLFLKDLAWTFLS